MLVKQGTKPDAPEDTIIKKQSLTLQYSGFALKHSTTLGGSGANPSRSLKFRFASDF